MSRSSRRSERSTLAAGLQISRELVRQARLRADGSGHRGDIVRHAVERDLRWPPAGNGEQRPAGAGIAVLRLAGAAGVDEQRGSDLADPRLVRVAKGEEIAVRVS